MTVGENIKKCRLEKGMTQKELGDKCGLADSAIRRYELGGANPKFETLKKIADALNIDVLYLLCIDEHDIETINITNKNTPDKKPAYANLPECDYSLGWEDWLHYNNIDFLYWDLDDEKGWLMKFIDTKEMFFLPQSQAEQLPLLSIEYIKTMIRTFGEKIEKKDIDSNI